MALELILALPWLILSPLNFIKVLRNTPSPMAHYFVAKESEDCQKTCRIARMWATMFWSLQFVLALALLINKRPRWMFVLSKIFIGTILLFNFSEGVVKLPIGAAGGFELISALLLFVLNSPELKEKTS
mmetsp:Transcript_19879/g.29743  ORF Transcript_19879/g.29743 Transcript_19879/m.29743 type:complete len:129 (-) Transcript_19879:80-466(-)